MDEANTENNSRPRSTTSTPTPTHTHAHSPKTKMSTQKGLGIIAACTLAMMNNVGSGPAITVTLPDIGQDLGIPAANLQWVISAYSLTSVRLRPFFGVS